MVQFSRWWLFLCVVVLLPPLAQAHGPYRLVPFGEGIPTGLTEGPRVVGSVIQDRNQLAASFDMDGTRVLGTLEGGLFSHANGACGDWTYGYSGTGPLSLYMHAWRQRGGDVLQDLGTTGEPFLFSAASAGLCDGRAAGYADSPDGSRIVPVVWDADGTIRILDTRDAGNIFTTALNAAGDVAGDGESQCRFWPAEGDVIDCHDPSLGRLSIALDLNAGQEVVGLVDFQAFRWTPDEGMVLLGTLPGYQLSRANAINAAGVIVGESSRDPSPPFDLQSESVCTLWETPGAPVDLHTRVSNGEGWELRSCLGITDTGVLAGRGRLHGVDTIFVAIPEEEVVEPPPPRKPRRAHHIKDRLSKHTSVSDARIQRWLAHEAQEHDWTLDKFERAKRLVERWKARQSE